MILNTDEQCEQRNIRVNKNVADIAGAERAAELAASQKQPCLRSPSDVTNAMPMVGE
jgi:hypothetical protein